MWSPSAHSFSQGDQSSCNDTVEMLQSWKRGSVRAERGHSQTGSPTSCGLWEASRQDVHLPQQLQNATPVPLSRTHLAVPSPEPNSTLRQPMGPRRSRGRCVERHPGHKGFPCTARHQEQQRQGVCATHSPGTSTQKLQGSPEQRCPCPREMVGNYSFSQTWLGRTAPSFLACPFHNREEKRNFKKELSFPQSFITHK